MALHEIGLVRAGRPATSAETVEMLGVDGTPLAIVHQAPPLLATLTVADLRRRDWDLPAPDPAVFARAGELFATAELAGLTPAEFCDKQSRGTGVPITTVRRSLADIRRVCVAMAERVGAERPLGAADAGNLRDAFSAVWVRRGDVLAVIAPSNNPGVHVQWVHAVALGYRVVVRPGARDPFTPARLVAALLAAGVEPAGISLLPGGHATGEALIAAADLSLVFGGDAAIKAYEGNRSVLPRGPGRSKLLQLGELTEAALETICASVGHDGGMRCTNATAVFTDGDPRAVGEAIAARLARLTPAPPTSPDAQVPVMAVKPARALREHLESRLAGAVDVAAPHYPDGSVHDLGDGSAALRPAVLVCDRVDHPGSAVELPFPCVWVLPWTPADGFAPLRNTLALTILGGDESLAARALREPTIRTVHLGPLPTFAAHATAPHDGYLGHELMEARGFAVAAG